MCTKTACDLEQEPQATCTPEHIWEYRGHRIGQYVEEAIELRTVYDGDMLEVDIARLFESVTLSPCTDEQMSYGLERALEICRMHVG